jgi:hypothetical protein
MIRPGEVYMADFGPAGPHPVIVTSRETLNRGRYALVGPQSAQRLKPRATNCTKPTCAGSPPHRRMTAALGMGGESPEGDLAHVAREFIRRAALQITPGPHNLSPY